MILRGTISGRRVGDPPKDARRAVTASGAGSAAVIPPTARAGSHAYTALAIPQRERCAANAPAPIRRSNHLAHRPHQSAMRSSALATLSILAASAAP